MKCKVIEVRTDDDTGIAEKLEDAIGSWLADASVKEIVSTQVQALDIGGPARAEILVLATVFYT